MTKTRRLVVLPIFALILAACQGGGDNGSPDDGDGNGDGDTVCAQGGHDGLLAEICEEGVIVVSTDPAYPPQSFLNPDTGDYEGFDIDVALAIGERLGVDVEFTDPTFDAVVAGSWGGRWDISVGSVTITEERRSVLDFTQAYYFTPAQMAAQADSDIESLDDFAGTAVCVGESTTYLFWIDGSLNLPAEAGDLADVPDGMTATTLPTDIDCAEAWRSGRTEDFAGWLTALPTAQGAIAEDYPIKLVGDPVFYEPLAVAFDASAEDNDSLVAAVDQIIGDMHDDGTLTALSEEWYEGDDLTSQE